MSSEDIVIDVGDLSKCYPVYERPQDRLKQSLFPRLQRMLGREGRQYYREYWALRGVSFQVARGETIGIIGRNGSGKSTLLQMICGTLAQTSGTLRTEGRIAALLELGSGFNPEFTGHENIYMNASLLGLGQEEIEAQYDKIVAFADIGDFIHQPIKTYSSGMMVRLAFAVVAHVNADILVVDEALAVGDAFFTQKCMRFLREFMKTGTVLFVSHDTSAVRSLCSRAIWLEKGVVVEEGPPKDVCEHYLEAFYEEQQGHGTTTRRRTEKQPVEQARPPILRDQRDAFINHSNLRNDLEVFQFDPERASFGKGGAEITHVEFRDTDANPLSWVVGGEPVVLRIVAQAHQPLHSIIVGFYIKDRLGQPVFGDNTFLSHIDSPVACEAGETVAAEFEFQMPRLAPGDYSITVAIADGTQHDHVQHHWMHDAIIFRSESSNVVSGLVGIPMQQIRLHTEQ